MSPPVRVLFVCTANICRSPFMELYCSAQAGLEVASAGTHGFHDQPVYRTVVDTLADLDIDASGFRSRRLTAEIVARADVVLTATTGHRTFILDEHPAEFRKVFTLGQFATQVGRTDADLTGHALIEHLGDRRGHADPADDIPDPYRRGRAAAQEAAALMTARIDQILPRLIPPHHS
ncbi:arsenate reductase/protein-tyrosine-phosphatase family protein [Nocardioides limicola]|uniref:arsenate reductase/protein-tyrosine-phosphatase family protein n=1 Tax=Nocardioides limicola TaxID=2803368 RepID=UPI0027DBF050|nr:hypothetical protein [Nocardioides sp. DJM-14]